ncbi:hypothetical protein B0H11DRAFT_2374700 [Mycena galericulata]|nr:hypothetical protein B0H11DRAFT_2374700 [Mycena galericulata]
MQVPMHPAYIPEPPSTPGSPQAQGSQRFASSPQPGQHQAYDPAHLSAYTSPFQHQQQPPQPPLAGYGPPPPP